MVQPCIQAHLVQSEVLHKARCTAHAAPLATVASAILPWTVSSVTVPQTVRDEWTAMPVPRGWRGAGGLLRRAPSRCARSECLAARHLTSPSAGLGLPHCGRTLAPQRRRATLKAYSRHLHAGRAQPRPRVSAARTPSAPQGAPTSCCSCACCCPCAAAAAAAICAAATPSPPTAAAAHGSGARGGTTPTMLPNRLYALARSMCTVTSWPRSAAPSPSKYVSLLWRVRPNAWGRAQGRAAAGGGRSGCGVHRGPGWQVAAPGPGGRPSTGMHQAPAGQAPGGPHLSRVARVDALHQHLQVAVKEALGPLSGNLRPGGGQGAAR